MQGLRFDCSEPDAFWETTLEQKGLATSANLFMPESVSTHTFDFRIAARTAAGDGPFSTAAVTSYECSPGFELTPGNGTGWCRTDAGGPLCRGVACEAIAAPARGRVSVSSAHYPSTALFECNPGYELQGDTSSACQVDGTWADADVTCTPVACPTPAIAHGAATTTSPRFPSNVSVTCEVGYGLVGAAVSACSTEGEWADVAACDACGALEYTPTPTSPCTTCDGCPPGARRLGCELNRPGTCEPCPHGYALVLCFLAFLLWLWLWRLFAFLPI